ncbi:MAG: c-type cytochrome, partial [bacterium]
PVVASPPLADVMALDAEEKVAFFNQRLELHCNTCHSREMIEQQDLTLAQWQAEVLKMINWGSTLPKDYQGLMAEHLSRLYPKGQTPKVARISPEVALAESLGLDLAAVSGDERQSEKAAGLYQTQCANCHGPEGKGAELGIRLVDRPMLTHPAAFGEITRKGRGIMPAFGESLKNEEVETIRRWLLGRSFSFQGE